MKKHIISLYTLVVIIISFQIAGFFYLSSTITLLGERVDKTKAQLQENINESTAQTQSKLSQLTSNLITTQESISKQLGEIKASTSSDFSGIVEQAVKSVVSIKTDVSQGSGFIINPEGYIITNAHVLFNGRYAKILTYSQELKNAELVGYDINLDIALLKIPGNYDFLKFGDSDDIKVGEKVIAVGNPYGLSFTVTEGIISARDRIGTNNLPYYFQTDVALNPGNSGGPLISKKGRVIGINNFKLAGGESLGFAMESNYVKRVLNDISLRALNQTII